MNVPKTIQSLGALLASLNGQELLIGKQSMQDALSAANNPSSTNPFLTRADASKAYNSYVALLTQSGTSAPTTDIMQNEIGDIVWTRLGADRYKGTLVGAFTSLKTYVSISVVDGASGFISCYAADEDTIEVDTHNNSRVSADDFLNGNAIEIRVYN